MTKEEFDEIKKSWTEKYELSNKQIRELLEECERAREDAQSMRRLINDLYGEDLRFYAAHALQKAPNLPASAMARWAFDMAEEMVKEARRRRG